MEGTIGLTRTVEVYMGLLWDRVEWESSQWDLENMAIGALASRGLTK